VGRQGGLSDSSKQSVMSAGARQTQGAGWRRTAKSHSTGHCGFHALCAGRTTRCARQQGWSSDGLGMWEPFGENKAGRMRGGMLLGKEAALLLQETAIFMRCWARELFFSMMGHRKQGKFLLLVLTSAKQAHISLQSGEELQPCACPGNPARIRTAG